MHDPSVVAFEIPRPWPQRSRWHDAKPGHPRWQIRLHHKCGSWCEDSPHHSNPFPWWRLRSYSKFWTLAGRGFYWPSIVVVWHEEPGGRDSGEVCKHYYRWQDETGKWQSKVTRGWRWHVWHWRIQLPPAQALRRWLLTRCAWCEGKSRKGNVVNVSHQWDKPKRSFWQRWTSGEPGLYHSGCSSAEQVARQCLCADPLLLGDHRGYAWETCATCGKSRMKDPISAQAYIDAVGISGPPVKGQRWEWPKEIDVHERRKAAGLDA